MAILDVIYYGHPTLRTVAEPVKPEELDEQFLNDMVETMHERDGVGLAANQVNVLKRVIVAHDFDNTYVLINPEIIAHSESMEEGGEGCLSLPGLQANVPRYTKVVVKALNEKGEPVEITAKGLLAIVMQHEIDHLNGTLYIDRADLSTLEWIDNDDLEGFPSNKPVTLDEVDRFYAENLFEEDEKLYFNPQNKS